MQRLEVISGRDPAAHETVSECQRAARKREEREGRLTDNASSSITSYTDSAANLSTIDTLSGRGTSTTRLESILSIETIEKQQSDRISEILNEETDHSYPPAPVMTPEN